MWAIVNCPQAGRQTHPHTHTRTYIYIYYMFQRPSSGSRAPGLTYLLGLWASAQGIAKVRQADALSPIHSPAQSPTNRTVGSCFVRKKNRVLRFKIGVYNACQAAGSFRLFGRLRFVAGVIYHFGNASAGAEPKSVFLSARTLPTLLDQSPNSTLQSALSHSTLT